MRLRSMVALLMIAGVLGILGALWSGSGTALGPVRMGEGGTADKTRNILMILTLIGGIGALAIGFTVKVFGRRMLGVAALIFAAFMVPACIYQANVLSILSVVLLAIVGITLLARPVRQPSSPTTETWGG